jgi:hypothetical protein
MLNGKSLLTFRKGVYLHLQGQTVYCIVRQGTAFRKARIFTNTSVRTSVLLKIPVSTPTVQPAAGNCSEMCNI